jgi:hypothetical protein
LPAQHDVIGCGALVLARLGEGLYLNKELGSMRPWRRFGEAVSFRWLRMAQPLSTPQQVSSSIQPSRRTGQAIATGAVLLGAVLVLGALALWFHYGTAVFFETIAAGISACF